MKDCHATKPKLLTNVPCQYNLSFLEAHRVIDVFSNRHYLLNVATSCQHFACAYRVVFSSCLD